MVTLLVIAIVLMVACIAAFIIKNKELPKSISAMVYDLPNGTVHLNSYTVFKISRTNHY